MVEAIKQQCHTCGISIAELERLAMVPENSIYKWDKHSPSVSRVARVARVLDVTVDDLIGGDEDEECRQIKHGKTVRDPDNSRRDIKQCFLY